MKPDLLYHGSMYKSAELMPGFKRSGKLVKWDKTESNMNLYATTDKEEAISLGFASAVEKTYGLDEYHTHDGGAISLKIPKRHITVAELGGLDVYVYTIVNRDEDEWQLNNNHHNNIEKEYKTTKTICQISNLEKVDVVSWLKSRKVTLLGGPPAFEAWK